MKSTYILGFLDVLGFASKFETFGIDEIHAHYSKITDYVRKQTGGINIVPTADGQVAVGWLILGHAYFSDTILFWTEYNKMALPGFTELMSETVCYSIEQQLPLRGTISVGEAIFDIETHTYLGGPIIEGAKTELVQTWIGISFGSSFMKDDLSQGFHLHTVLPYKSHYKDKENIMATGMVVDWPRKWRETRKTDVRPVIQALDTVTEAHPYYENTMRFVDFSEENHDWFKNGGHLSYG